MAIVPIASLAPSTPIPAESSINTVVSLLWPYSSMTKSCALLLAETDARLRYKNGQVRVRFTGPSAQAVAKAHVGIGDRVELKLGGATWLAQDVTSSTKTPGKSVDGELVFGQKIYLRCHKSDGTQKIVEVNDPTPPPSPSKQAATPRTPIARLTYRQSLGNGTMGTATYSSPASMKRLRLSQGSYVDSPRLSLGDSNDWEDGSARKRRRVSYKNVSEWKYSDQVTAAASELASEENDAEDDASTLRKQDSEISSLDGKHAEDRASSSALQALKSRGIDGRHVDTPKDNGTARKPLEISSASSSLLASSEEEEEPAIEQGPLAQNGSNSIATIPTSVLPQLQIPPEASDHMDVDGIEPTTPRLQPVSATTLPLPSPFPSSKADSHFEDVSSSSALGNVQGPQNLTGDEAAMNGHNILQIPETQDASHNAVEPQKRRHEDGDTGRNTESNFTSVEPKAALLLRPDESLAEGNASPSSGSEADVESEYEYNEIEKLQDAHSDESYDDNEDMALKNQDPTLREEVDEPELAFDQEDESDNVKPYIDADHGSYESEEELSESLAERSDDESNVEVLEAPTQLTDPDEAIMPEDTEEESVAEGSREAESAWEGFRDDDQQSSEDVPYSRNESRGLDGTVMSRQTDDRRPTEVYATHHPTFATSAENVVEDEPVSSQDEDAAWDLRAVAVEELDETHRADAGVVEHTTTALPPPVEIDRIRVDKLPPMVLPETQERHEPISESRFVELELAEADEQGSEHGLPNEDSISAAATAQPTTPDILEAGSAMLDAVQATPPTQRIKDVMSTNLLPSQEMDIDPQDGAGQNGHLGMVAGEVRAVDDPPKTGLQVIDLDDESENNTSHHTPSPSAALILEVGSQILETLQPQPPEAPKPEPEIVESILDEPTLADPPREEATDQILEQSESKDVRPVLDEYSMADFVQEESVDQIMQEAPAKSGSSFVELESAKSSFAKSLSTFESIDLSQVEPDYMRNVLPMTLSQSIRTAPVSDSVDSPATTLLADDDKPDIDTIRDDDSVEGVSGLHRQLEDDKHHELLLASQRRGEHPGATPERQHSDLVPLEADRNHKEHFEAQERGDISHDDKLLAEFVNPDASAPSLEAADEGNIVNGPFSAIAKAQVTDESSSEVVPSHVQVTAHEDSDTLADSGVAAPASQVKTAADEEKLVPTRRFRHSRLQATPPPLKVKDKSSPTRQKPQVTNVEAETADAVMDDMRAMTPHKGTEAELAPTPVPMETIEEVDQEPVEDPRVKAGAEDSPLPATAQLRRSSRKSAARLSSVSDAMGEWFARSKSGAQNEEKALVTPEPPAIRQPSVAVVTPSPVRRSQRHVSKQRSVSPPLLQRPSQSQLQGLSTSLSYFSPLTDLERHLNQPSTATIDVIGVVASAASDPVRAKAGPRDWFTIFFVSDPALQDFQDSQVSEGSPRNRAAPRNIRVEVFRPWKASLPAAEPGDVVVLRSFVVKSRTRRPYLLSCDASAWCVWKFSAAAEVGQDAGEKPAWARRRSSSIREEVKGPPLDIGAEERGWARELRNWWEKERMPGHQSAKAKERATGGDGDGGLDYGTPSKGPRL